jgi:FecR protein
MAAVNRRFTLTAKLVAGCSVTGRNVRLRARREFMRIWPSIACRFLTAAVVTLCAWTAHADDTDPPGRAARLSAVQGSVSLEPAGVQEWTAATLNRPLTTGDRLWGDASSRAELDMGAAVVRLGGMTGFSFLNLDDNSAQMQLTAGTLIVRVRDMRAGDNYEIDTPNVAVTLQQPGEYRIEVNEAGDATVVKVSEGLAQASGAGQLVQVPAQQRFSFSGTGELTAGAATLGAPDELDAWSAARELQLEDSPSREYVADDVAGTQDLDDNGKWQETPQYGYVWTPTVVAVGWAPYRYGQWAWVGPWGWTWIDDARWGYAPFHYGRWVSVNNAWCWVPGPRIARPVYAPALVGWVAGPAGGPLTVYGSNVGWFPLGPHEAYVPGYRVSTAYARNVNVTNTTMVNNTYVTNVYTYAPANPRYLNNTSAAVTAVPQDVFTSGQRLAGHVQRIAPALLTGAVAGAVAPAIVPSRASVLGADAARGTARPPQAVLNRPVVARTPLPRAPVPFDRQVSAIEANGGRPLARADLARLQPAAAAVPVRMIAAAPASRPDGRGVAPASGAAAPGFADREHALQNTTSLSTPHAAPYGSSVETDTGHPRASGVAAAAATPAPRYDRPAVPAAAPRTVAPDPGRMYEHPAATAAPTYASPGVPASAPLTQHPQPQPYRAPVPVVSAPAVRESAPAPMREAVPAMHPPMVVRPSPPSPAPSAPKPAPQPQGHDSSSQR